LGSLQVATEMISTMRVKPARMRAAAEQGFVNATDAADYLAKKGLPFREAHEVAGKLVGHCVAQGCELLSLSLDDLRRFSSLFDADIFEAISLETVVDRRVSRGGTGSAAVSEQVQRIEADIRGTQGWLGAHRSILERL
jgi:argininosuccinate lyase